MIQQRSTIIVVALLVLLPAARPACGAVLYDSGGFEAAGTPSRFTPGALEGQDPSFGPWATDNNVSSAAIETAVVQSGGQAVRIDRAPSVNGDQRWSVFKPTGSSPRYLLVSWDQNITQTNQAGVSHGPLFGVEAYDDTGGATVPLIGAGFVDSTTGSVYYQAHTTGDLVATGSTAAFGQWNHFALQADFTTSTYQLFLNGSQVASDGFVDAGITGFSDAPLTTVAFPDGAGSNAVAAGTSYFDNYVISTSASTPEPAALGICGVGVLLLALRVRQVPC